MSEGGGFKWDDSGIPKKPVDDAAPEQPPAEPWDQPTQAYTPPAELWDQPTQAYTPPAESWDEPTQAYTPPAEPAAATPDWDQPTEAYNFDRAELMPPAQEAQQTSAIDSLFGESQFKEYEASAFPAEAVPAIATPRPRTERVPLGSTQKILFWVAGGLVAVIILVAVFMLGRSMPGLIPERQADAPAPAATAAPVAAAPVVGPVAPGEYEWDELLGTECIEPFTSPWEEAYTVVDCTAAHSAQLVYRGMFADESFATYPGLAELQARINLLCTSPASIDYAVASGLSDIAVSASYAATAQQWDAGQRQYYCFLTRSTGEPMTVSLANAPVVDPAPVASIPSSDP